MTISTIHRVSLSTHDLAKARQFFEAQLGLGRAVKVDEQTLAFGNGSRGLRIKKPRRLLTRTTSEIHGRRSRSAWAACVGKARSQETMINERLR